MSYMARAIFVMIPVLALSLVSCTDQGKKEVTIPKGIIDEAQFTSLMVDFSLAESAVNMNIRNVALSKSDSVYAFNPLKEHGIRKAQYDSSVTFYTRHPQLYKRIYDNVMARLIEMKARGGRASEKENEP